MTDPVSLPSPRASVVPVVVSLCALFIISQFYRSAIAVMAPELSRDMGLSAETLGLLTGAFFVASALMQLPVGVLLDRYGPRRVVPSILTVAVAGALVFASAASGPMLVLGQFMVGLGCSGVFMGGLVAFSRWFPAEKFTTVAGAAIAVSISGTLLSGTPLAAAMEAFGWRNAIYATAAITALVGGSIPLLVRDAPPGHPYLSREPETLRQTLRGVGEVIRNRHIYPILALAFCSYSVVMSVRGLWGGPYLADIHGLGTLAIGHVLLAMSGAILVSFLGYGPLERRGIGRKRLVLSGGSITVASFCLLALTSAAPLWLAVGLFCLLAAFGGYYVLLLAHGRALFPDRLVGRAMTTINFATFAGVGTMQVTTGLIVGAFPEAGGAAPEAAYRAVFGFLALVLATALIIYSRSRPVPPGA
ncbi:MAG: MFS transporter [Alphaproteobacteria bacterium]|nr:MFS transporter [Alphaproteobacteria bacterium]